MQRCLLARYFEHAHPETIPRTCLGNKRFSFSSFNAGVFLKAVDGKAAFRLEACTEAFFWLSTSKQGKMSLDSYFLLLRNHLCARTFLSEASDYEDFVAAESTAVLTYTVDPYKY